MKNLLPLLTAVLALSFLSAEAQMKRVPGEMILQFTADADPDKVLEQYDETGSAQPTLAIDRVLSPHMRLYLVKFDPELQSPNALLDALRRDESVSIAQFNHYVQQRENDEIIPNDPEFDGQWHHKNTGQNGGTPGADIRSAEAWDITTGGLTATGDTIVVCVIEGGNLAHPDLIDNAWINHAEIPGDGIDNDDNGFIDDYLGWNVATESDEGVYQGNHGTQVMGMIGAVGDNDLGVSGINWNVKIMSVRGQNLSNEASVVAAYNYPLVQRKLYNETDGDRGAFVVATNASWGINQGDMQSVPVWNAFYDTLGVYGILNCGATANAQLDVDAVGDIPTGSESPYMVAVTATDRNDQRNFSAFGATLVDVAAPGEQVLTTSGAQGYNAVNGTSFASPLTAGVIALMYSVPCPSLMDLVKDNPQLGADYIRYALYEGVDPVESLQGMIATGGRINAYTSVKMLVDNCGEDICLPPFSFNYEVTDDVVYTFTWNTVDTNGVALRYRAEGEEEWTVLEDYTEDSFEFIAPELCTVYEFEIASECSATEGEYVFGSTRTFETLGCCIAPEEVEVLDVEVSSIALSWEPDFALDMYEVFYREQGTSEWFSADITEEGTLVVEDLESCTFYDLLVQPTCAEDFEIGTVTTVRTKDCGLCIDGDYCENFGTDSSFEFIESVEVGDWFFESGNNGGYALFEETDLSLETWGEYDMTVTPGFTFWTFNEFIRVWIDYNQDGEFTEDELVLSSTEGSNQPVSGSFTVPEDADLGVTRMRVAMKYVTGAGQVVEACEIFDDGETEDYCVEILEGEPTVSTSNSSRFGTLNLFPNPNSGSFDISLSAFGSSEMVRPTLRVFDITGKVISQSVITKDITRVEMPNAENGIYLYSIVDGSTGETVFNGKFVIAK